jgi:prevent-host-death family protein
MANEIPVTRAGAEHADLINRVVYGGERVVVTRHGKPLVALVSAAGPARPTALPGPGPGPAGERAAGATCDAVDAGVPEAVAAHARDTGPDVRDTAPGPARSTAPGPARSTGPVPPPSTADRTPGT